MRPGGVALVASTRYSIWVKYRSRVRERPERLGIVRAVTALGES